MVSLPPRPERSSRRKLTLKPGASLPDLPRFEVGQGEPSSSAEQPRPEQTHQEQSKAAVSTEAQAETFPAKASSDTTSAPPERPLSERRKGKAKRDEKDDAPQPLPKRSRKAATGVSEAVYVTIRLRFDPEVKQQAVDFCEATGAALRDLALLAVRNMDVTDADYAATPLWPGPLQGIREGETHRLKCKLSSATLDKWSKKLDPLGMKTAGEVAYNAVQHAFNRSARTVMADLMKAR